MKYRIVKVSLQDKTIYVAEKWDLKDSIMGIFHKKLLYSWIWISNNDSLEEAEKSIEKHHKKILQKQQPKEPIREVIREFEL